MKDYQKLSALNMFCPAFLLSWQFQKSQFSCRKYLCYGGGQYEIENKTEESYCLWEMRTGQSIFTPTDMVLISGRKILKHFSLFFLDHFPWAKAALGVIYASFQFETKITFTASQKHNFIRLQRIPVLYAWINTWKHEKRFTKCSTQITKDTIGVALK